MFYSKQQLIDSIVHECTICKHLYGKLPAGSLDYRPTPGQRSTAELLQYLSIAAIGSARAFTEGNWGAWRSYDEAAAAMRPEDFPAAMDRQIEEISALIEGLSDEMLAHHEVALPTGKKLPLGAALIESSLKWIVAYRMQLFLYAKSAGADALSTRNCWAGVDAPPKKAPVETVEG